jgi:hypothetical protein
LQKQLSAYGGVAPLPLKTRPASGVILEIGVQSFTGVIYSKYAKKIFNYLKK